MSAPTKPTVVLVHGAFADASGFAAIIGELTARGYAVVAPPNQLRGVANDAATVHSVVAAIEGPVLLVGHSYGGAVITQAVPGLENVVGLVYLAAFAPDVGESCASVQEPFPATLLGSTIRPTSYDATGAAGGPEFYISQDGFRDTFAADSTAAVAAAMYATQRPLAAAAFTEQLTAAGWKDLPCWYLVSTADNAIPPDAERFMAKRMSAVTEEIEGSHTAFVARPVATADFIEKAAAGQSSTPS